MASRTGFLESDALLAQQSGEESEVGRILDQLLPGELRTLAAACETLAFRCREVAAEKRAHEARWHE